MKKILLTIGYFILIIVSSVMIIRYAYNAYLIHQYNRQNYNVTSTPLTLLNFTESYIVHYNQGNIYYKQGNYEDAIRAYNIALALRMPKKKECDVRVNLALAMLGTIKDTYADLSYAEETKQVLLAARDVLLQEECAKDDGEGHDKEAQKLKEEIDKMLEQLQQQQQDQEGGEDSDQSNDNPNEDNSESSDEQQTEEEKQQEQAKKQREEMMKNQLKEKQEKAAAERDDELTYVNGFDDDYNFLNTDPIW